MVGIHLSTLCSHSWTEPLGDHIRTAAEIGYDGVEFPLMDPENFPVEKYESLLKSFSLKCTCGTGLNMTNDLGDPSPTIQKAGIAHLKHCIEISAQLESPVLGGVLLGAWGRCSIELRSKEWRSRVVDNLAEVLDHAKKHNVRLAVELLNRYESSLINSTFDAQEWMQLISHENFGFHYDTFHAHIEERNHLNALSSLGKKLYHFHICGSDRGLPQDDAINWDSVVAGLKSSGYDQWLTVELFTQGGSSLGADVSVWHKSPLSLSETARKAYQFARALEQKIKE